MKRIFLLVVGALMPFVVAAQSERTAVAVDVTVQRVHTTPGPYARFAQRLLGVRSATQEGVAYSILGAEIALSDVAPVAGELPEATVERGYEVRDLLPADKLDLEDTTDLTEKAVRAADLLFSVRRARLDLITGDAGEYVFGAGLPVALERLDAMEQQLLELFVGRRIVSVDTQRVVLSPMEGENHQTVTHFSAESGLGGKGEELSVRYRPEEINLPMEMPVQPKKGAPVVMKRVAVQTLCTVELDGKALAQRTLPMLQFGYDLAQ